jgi:hypothetical protein
MKLIEGGGGGFFKIPFIRAYNLGIVYIVVRQFAGMILYVQMLIFHPFSAMCSLISQNRFSIETGPRIRALSLCQLSSRLFASSFCI